MCLISPLALGLEVESALAKTISLGSSVERPDLELASELGRTMNLVSELKLEQC